MTWPVQNRLVAFALLGVVSLLGCERKQPAAVAPTETPEEKRAETLESFTPAGDEAGTPDETDPSIQQFFAAARDGLASGDGQEFGRYFDTRRSLHALHQQGLLPDNISPDDAKFLNVLNSMMAQRLSDPTLGITWEKLDVRNVKPLDDKSEVLVYTRQWDANDISQKTRWWLVRHRGSWRAYDYEVLDVSMRFSAMMGLGFKMADQDDPSAKHIPTLISAVQDGVGGDPLSAIATLKELDGIAFPPVLEALRLMFLSALLCDQFEFEESLERAEQATKVNPDLPMVFLVTAACRNGLAQYDQALEDCQRYVELLGPDGDYYAVLGDTYAGLGETDKAIQAYRDGLADDAQAGENVLGLLKMLPPEEHADVQQHYEGLNEFDAWFISFADYAILAEDKGLLANVIELHRRVLPEDENIAYYEEVLADF